MANHEEQLREFLKEHPDFRGLVKFANGNEVSHSYDIERLKAVPVVDILRDIYGIEATKKGARYYCKIRAERTGSCCIYPTNTWFDFGSNVGGDGINLIEEMEHCDRKTAMEKLAQAYNISPQSKTRNEKELWDYEWRMLGLYPDLASKNLDINVVIGDEKPSRNADINLYPEDEKQRDAFAEKYYIPMTEFREKYPREYHNLLKKHVLYPLFNERDDYYSHLLNSYYFYEEIGGAAKAKEYVSTDENLLETAKQIREKSLILRRAVDDISLLKVPEMKLNPTRDLAALLDGSIEFQAGKFPYYKFFRAAQTMRVSIFFVDVPYSAYIQNHTPRNSKMRSIPHSVFYKNGVSRFCVMEQSLPQVKQIFAGEIMNIVCRTDKIPDSKTAEKKPSYPVK